MTEKIDDIDFIRDSLLFFKLACTSCKQEFRAQIEVYNSFLLKHCFVCPYCDCVFVKHYGGQQKRSLGVDLNGDVIVVDIVYYL